MKSSVFICMMIVAFPVWAQSSLPPFFTIDRAKGCPGMTVNMTYAFEDSANANPDFKPIWFWRNPFINFFQNISVSGITEIQGNSIRFLQQSPLINGVVQHYAIDVSANKLIGRLTFDYNNQTYQRTPYEIQVLEPKVPSFQIFLGDNYKVKVVFPQGPSRYYDEFKIEIGSDSFFVSLSQTEFEYSRVGTHTVKITGRFIGSNTQGGNCGSTAVSVTPFLRLPTPSAPAFRWSQKNQLIFDLSDCEFQNFVNYQLQIRDLAGNLLFFHNIFSNPAFPSSLIVDLPYDTIPLRIHVQPIDCCGSSTDDRQSASIYYIPIQALQQITTGNIQLFWRNYPESTLQHFILLRDNIMLKKSTQNSYQDTSLICGNQYCYELHADVRLADGKERTLRMNKICIESIFRDSIPLPSAFVATVNLAGFVEIDWKTTASKIAKSTLFKTSSTQQNSIIATSHSLYRDNQVNTNQESYCYTLDLEDSCGNTMKKGSKTCTILLNVENHKNYYILSWTPYVGFDSTQYFLEILDKNYSLLKTISLENNRFSFTHQDNSLLGLGEYFYRVCARNVFSSLQSCSNAVRVSEELNIRIPTAFSPNHDRLNDYFKPIIQNYQSYQLQIFNRWGTLIYQGNEDDEGWDGTIHQEPAPVGAYTYQLIIIDLNGKKIQKNGMFVLIR